MRRQMIWFEYLLQGTSTDARRLAPFSSSSTTTPRVSSSSKIISDPSVAMAAVPSHRKSLLTSLLTLCALAVILCSLGNVLFFQTTTGRSLEAVTSEDDYDHSGLLRRTQTKNVQIIDTTRTKPKSGGSNSSVLDTVKLPPQYLLNKPFYVYEDLLWLNSTTNGETIESMLMRGYTWKHNDDIWFVNAALKHPMRTMNPEEAVLFVVPSFVNMFLSAQTHRRPCIPDLGLCSIDALRYIDEQLGKSPWFQRNQGKDHVMVASMFSSSMRLAFLPNFIKCNMIGMESRKFNVEGRYTAPSQYVGSPCLPRQRDYDFAMIASMHNRSTFESRQNICDWLEQDRPQYSMSACGKGEQCPALAQARFGFHVRGDTYGANRLIDTILTGTVPIFTMKEQYDILPDWIKWEEFSYFADVSDKDRFLQAMDEIINNEALYQQKRASLMANRDLFDWQTHTPFDTYMYMFMAQIYPQYRRPQSDSPFPVLQLSKPEGFDAFDPEKKHVWCGDSGPAKTCGECPLLLGSRMNGCRRMCRWCEYGYAQAFSEDFVDDPESCVPHHYTCKQPTGGQILEKVVRPFKKLPVDLEWCFPGTAENKWEVPEDVHGLLLAKTYKTGSSTAAGVTLQIAHRVGKRKGFASCFSRTDHNLSTDNQVAFRDEERSIVWTTVRDPAARALSTFAYYSAGKGGREVTDEILIKNFDKNKNNQIAQLRTERGKSAIGNGATKEEDVPKDHLKFLAVIQAEIAPTYDFIAVTERMDESLVVMKMLWNLEDGDIIVSSMKQSGSWTYNWNPPQTCFFVPKLTVSPRLQEYIDTDFKHDNFDYILHEYANRSLDATIDLLGRERVRKEVTKYRALKKLVIENCRDQIIPPCNDDGEFIGFDSCWKHDIGCGHVCINDFLDQYEEGLVKIDSIALNSAQT